MAKAYQISNNVIFSVNEDGSITKFATISESGDVCRIGEKKKIHNGGRLWLAVIILSIGICVLGMLYYTTWSEYRMQINLTHASEMKYIKSNKEVGRLEREIATLKSKKNLDEFEMLNLKQKITGSYPIIISDIKIANSYRQGTIETDYGNTIYSVNTMRKYYVS